jgi:hypothetical protein
MNLGEQRETEKDGAPVGHPGVIRLATINRIVLIVRFNVLHLEEVDRE